jgi:hypothetical protein
MTFMKSEQIACHQHRAVLLKRQAADRLPDVDGRTTAPKIADR